MDKAKLKGIPLFAELEDKDLAVIATFAAEKSVGEGDTLVREGDFANELIAIEEGTAEVLRGSDVVAELGPGDFFGEVGVVSKELRSATVRATSSMRLITLNQFDVKRMRDMPGVMEKIDQAAETRAAD